MRGLSSVALAAALVACGTNPPPPPGASGGREPECGWVRDMEAAQRIAPPVGASSDASVPDASAAPPQVGPEPVDAARPDALPLSTLRPQPGAVECRVDAECAPKEACCPPLSASSCGPSSVSRRPRCDGIMCPEVISRYACACQAGRCTGVVVSPSRIPFGPP